MALTEREKLEIAETADRVRRAILTLNDQSVDGEMQAPTAWPQIIREASKMDYADAPRVRMFEPTRQDIDLMLPTLDWLTWLKNRPVDGELYFRIVWSRAYETPWWKLAGRLRKSERTVQRRHEEAIHKIWGQFGRYDKHVVDAVSKMCDTVA